MPPSARGDTPGTRRALRSAAVALAQCGDEGEEARHLGRDDAVADEEVCEDEDDVGFELAGLYEREDLRDVTELEALDLAVDDHGREGARQLEVVAEEDVVLEAPLLVHAAVRDGADRSPARSASQVYD